MVVDANAGGGIKKEIGKGGRSGVDDLLSMSHAISICLIKQKTRRLDDAMSAAKRGKKGAVRLRLGEGLHGVL